MQKITKKEQIIKDWLEDQKQTVDELALKYHSKKAFVSIAIDGYLEEISIRKNLYLTPSFIYEHDFILFDDRAERRVKTVKNKIQNPEDFSKYELLWMAENYRLYEMQR